MDKYNLGIVGGITVTELFSGSEGNVSGSFSGTLTLNDDISNYKFLVFDLMTDFNNSMRCFSRIISCPHYLERIGNSSIKWSFFLCMGYSSSNDYFNITSISTLKTINFTGSNSKCVRILGIN